MKFLSARSFTGSRAWDALPIANLDGVTVRLHWTDEPYRWHVNSGAEVFVVLDGQVEMHWRCEGEERVTRMQPGDIFYAAVGDAHVAHPVGPARVLVVEREGSV